LHQKRVTVYDIAQPADVSHITVALALLAYLWFIRGESRFAADRPCGRQHMLPARLSVAAGVEGLTLITFAVGVMEATRCQVR
jgi:hypothetical protein